MEGMSGNHLVLKADGIFCVYILMVFFFFFNLGLLSYHWAPLREVYLPLPHSQLSFAQIDKVSLSLLLSRLNSHSSLSLSSCSRCFSPLIISVALCWTCSSRSPSPVLRSPELDLVSRVWPHQYWAEKVNHLPETARNVLPNAAQDAVGILCYEGEIPLEANRPIVINVVEIWGSTKVLIFIVINVDKTCQTTIPEQMPWKVHLCPSFPPSPTCFSLTCSSV